MKPLIIANWKMNPSNLAEAKQLFNSVAKGVKNIKNTDTVICPPYIQFSVFNSRFPKNIKLGAQDVFWEEKGAFTGEISPKMLKDIGCQYVIIGHSERRNYQKETDQMVNKKVKAVLKEGLKPILCVETLNQIRRGLKGISGKDLKKIVFAYEPVFAIGTGHPCSLERAGRVRLTIKKSFKNIPILYGGSVNSQNAQLYIQKAGFQGLLVGGASLNSKEFLKIVKSIDFMSKT